MTRSVRRALIVALPFVLAWAAVLAVYAALRDRLPDPLATHIGSGGEPDGFTGPGAFLSVSTALILVPGIVAAAIAHRSRTALGAQRLLVATGYGTPAMLGYITAALLFANADVSDPAAVDFPLWHLAVSLAVAGAVGWVGWLLAGLDAPSAAGPAAGPAGPRLPLAKGEAAVWTHTIGSPVLVGAGVLTVVVGAALALALASGWAGGGPLMAVGVLTAALSRCRVTVDRRGLTVAPWFAPRPRLRMPLARIDEATSREVRALDLGGWGYRMRAGRSALVLRSGDALCLRLATGKEFVVTVDDAATAAALLNALRERVRTGPGRQG
ncbi:hypothetical protein ABZS71_03405 [Streptomyces sp. NPDC005393]|uniref:hypothetical protein n=1 Tax=Streptomyces sp. NPDC005393 TaxID=3157041 RepID=UPI0033A6DFE5